MTRSASDDAERSASGVLGLAYGIFFASGFAALLYQVIWQRMLALFSGADVFSATLIVAAFMGGLGTGNLVGGHLADRLSRRACLVLFAAAELSIGLFAVGSRYFYYDVLYARVGALDLGVPVLATTLFAAVLWPTFFMGVSLPLLARGLTHSLGTAARTVGSLYGWNTLGAAVGACVTTWVLLRRYDLASCIQIGAALNFGCALAVVPLRARLARGEAPDSFASAAQRQPSGEPHARGAGLGVGSWLLVYALSGAIALSLEIAWFRALGVMLKSTSFSFGTLLAVYLAGVGAGSLVGSGLVERNPRAPAARFFAFQTLVPLTALAALALVVWLAAPSRLTPLWLHLRTTDHLPLTWGFAALGARGLGVLTSANEGDAFGRGILLVHGLLPLALIGPPTFLMGLSFPFLQRAVQTDPQFVGRRVGWLQTANIAGSLGGSLLTGFVLLPRLGTPGTFRALALVSIAFPLLAMAGRTAGGRRGWLAPVGALALLLAALVLPPTRVFWGRLHGVEPRAILAAEDATGVSLLRPHPTDPKRTLVMAGGVEVSEIPYGGEPGIHTLLGALPVLLHPNPRRVAVIGLGSGDTAYAAAGREEVEELVVVEIIGSQLDLLRRSEETLGDPGLSALLSDPRVQIEIGDGRSWLRHDPVPYDVIEADALRPTAAYSGNLFSLEYFALLRARLAKGGLAVSWLPTPRVRRTFARAFPHVLVLGDQGFGSETPIPFDPEQVRARAREPWVRRHFERAGIEIGPLVDWYLDNGPPRSLGPAERRPGDVNRDLFPQDEFLIPEPLRALLTP